MTISHNTYTSYGIISALSLTDKVATLACSGDAQIDVRSEWEWRGGRTDLTSGDKIMRQKEDQGAPLDTWLGGA